MKVLLDTRAFLWSYVPDRMRRHGFATADPLLGLDDVETIW